MESVGVESTSPKARVLIADDTEDVRELVRLSLTLDGRFEVVGEAADGREAVRAASVLLPDAVVLDLAMPVMDGLQALPEIRRAVPSASVVVLSGFSARRMEVEVREAGADAYVEKAGAFDGLAALLAQLCGLTDEPSRPSRLRAVGGLEGGRASGPSLVEGDDPFEVGAFLAHELGNPLAVIAGFARTLSDSLDRLDRRAAANAAAAIERQAAQIKQMLSSFTLARLIDVGKVDLHRQAVDLANLVRETVADLTPVTQPHPVTVAASSVPAYVDPVRVRQVVVNLVANAAKFSPSGRCIEVVVQRNATQASIDVMDRCDGIPESLHGRLFEKFSRPLRGPGGSGLGLYISRGFARAHGGDLTYNPRPGGGCSFRLTLPLPSG